MATANGTPTSVWTLVKNATAKSEGSVSCQYVDLEYAITETATAPAASLEGHYVPARHTEPVDLKAGNRLWWRIAPARSGTTDGVPVGIYTIDEV